MSDKKYTTREFYNMLQMSDRQLVETLCSTTKSKLEIVKMVKHIKNLGLRQAKELVDEYYHEDLFINLYLVYINIGSIVIKVFKGKPSELKEYIMVYDLDKVTVKRIEDSESGNLPLADIDVFNL